VDRVLDCVREKRDVDADLAHGSENLHFAFEHPQVVHEVRVAADGLALRSRPLAGEQEGDSAHRSEEPGLERERPDRRVPPENKLLRPQSGDCSRGDPKRSGRGPRPRRQDDFEPESRDEWR